MSRDQDIYYMQKAVQLATQAAFLKEVPVGAVLVLEDRVIGEGHNASISLCDPTAHAEMMALRHAAKAVGNYRLLNTTLYVTLEPCMMCAGALVHARISRLVYAAQDPKAGVVITKATLLHQPFLNHEIKCEGGILAEQCGTLLSQFFANKR